VLPLPFGFRPSSLADFVKAKKEDAGPLQVLPTQFSIEVNDGKGGYIAQMTATSRRN
jgi:hypothetical protein